jgi:biotin synthase
MNRADMAGREAFTRDERVAALSATDPAKIEAVRRAAHETLLNTCGPGVYYRGLIEYSNICASDCLYCGIRRSNRKVRRYELDVEDLLKAAVWCAEQGYGSAVIQSGERRDGNFIDTVVEAVREIKKRTIGDSLPDGLGITLCVGEQSKETYERFFEAGAHRYLLRIETSNPNLFANIHPPGQSFEARLACLRTLREVGYQVGTGVMIGLPGQTVSDLADDVAFFVKEDIDMIGMGPFIPHEDTPLYGAPCPDEAERMRLSLLMIAMLRLSMPDINIAATTALHALDPIGREKGLLFGANVIMPLLTPADVSSDYLLYPGKPSLDETAAQSRRLLEERITDAGRWIGHNRWGDSPRALKRQKAVDKSTEAEVMR